MYRYQMYRKEQENSLDHSFPVSVCVCVCVCVCVSVRACALSHSVVSDSL